MLNLLLGFEFLSLEKKIRNTVLSPEILNLFWYKNFLNEFEFQIMLCKYSIAVFFEKFNNFK